MTATPTTARPRRALSGTLLRVLDIGCPSGHAAAEAPCWPLPMGGAAYCGPRLRRAGVQS